MRLLTIALAAFLITHSDWQASAEEPEPAGTEPVAADHFSAKPAVVAALLAAQQRHDEWLASQDRPNGPAALISASWYVSVHVTKSGDYLVSYGPPTHWHRGGGVEYLISPKTFEVKKQSFTR
jgi:hypothetical protein